MVMVLSVNEPRGVHTERKRGAAGQNKIIESPANSLCRHHFPSLFLIKSLPWDTDGTLFIISHNSRLGRFNQRRLLGSFWNLCRGMRGGVFSKRLHTPYGNSIKRDLRMARRAKWGIYKIFGKDDRQSLWNQLVL
jgi:hypothetical protein